MAFVCYDVDNLVLYQLELKDISQLVQTNKYWKRRMAWFIEDYKKIRGFPWNIKTIEGDFQGACFIGSLKMAIWFWDKYDHTINIHANNEGAFRWSCFNGHFEVAKWLWEISNHTINIHANDKCVFRVSCYYSHFEIKWLCQICPDYSIEYQEDKIKRGLYKGETVWLKY